MNTPRFGLLVLAMAPGVFSGVCSVLLAFPLYRYLAAIAGAKGPPIEMYWAEAFGLLSGVSACALYVLRRRVLGMSSTAQMIGTACVWIAHVAAFVVLMVAMI